MEDKVMEVQKRLRERLSSRFAMSESALEKPIVCFEQVVGPPSCAEDLVPRVCAELKKRGYKVATVKLGRPSDALSAEEREALPDASYCVVSGRVYLEREYASEPGIDEVLEMLGDGFDVIVGEGFGYAPAPKFLVTEKPNEGFNLGLPNIIGYVSDSDEHAFVPHFTALDVGGIADRIEEVVVARREPSAS